MRKTVEIKPLPRGFVKCPVEILRLLATGELRAIELSLWIILRARCGSGETCFPSLSTLARDICVSREYTNDLALRLEKKKLLKMERRQGRSHIYTPLLPDAPVNHSSQVERNLGTTVNRGCEPQFSTPVNHSSHINRCKETEELNQSTSTPTAGKKSRKKRKSNPESTRVYNQYIELRRKATKKLNWNQTKDQALMMRSNIKTWFDNGHTADDLIEALEGFFLDTWAGNRGFSWEIFAKDPLKYCSACARAVPEQQAPVPAAHRKLD